MACATLKRNFDWDVSMSQTPAKRRRCAPISKSPGLKVEPTTTNSIFGESVCASAKLSPERLLHELCNEMKRLRRRRQLKLASGANASSSSSGSEGDSSPTHHSFSNSSKQQVHKALFTFKQVRLICERMLREQEAALRAEYDSALNDKLAEQYEAFVRFNIDQVQRRPPPSTCIPLGMDTEHMHQDLVPSYLS